MVAGATAGTRQKLLVLTSSSSDVSSDNAAATTGNKITEPHPAQNVQRGAVKEVGMCHVQFNKSTAVFYGLYSYRQ